MNIPFFNYPAIFSEHSEEYLSVIMRCLSHGHYIMQEDLLLFEAELAQYLGCKKILGFADGTSALIAALRLAGIGYGDEVIVPSHTFIATASAVHQVGAIPVICDCGPDHLIDVESARNLISNKTRAIMPVQLNGRCSNMDLIKTLCSNYGLKIIEDSCQALGAKYKNKFAGSFGVAGSFSFYPSKTLGCFGDGGALLIDDESLIDIAYEYRDHGRNPTTGIVNRFGVNARLDNIQAAVLRVKLKYYDSTISRRRNIAQLYQTGLGDLDNITLPPPPNQDETHFDIFQNYEVNALDRDNLRKYLSDSGVGTIVQWGGKMVHQFNKLNLKSHAPYADKISSTYMMLPMHQALKDEEVYYIIDKIRSFYAH